MIKDITLGQFFPGESVLHKMDARTKLLLTLAMIVLIFCVHTYIGYIAIAAVLLLAIILSQVGIKFVLNGVKPIMPIMIFTFLLNIFFLEGENVVFEWLFIRITLEGLIKSVETVVRLVLLVVASTMMTLTTSPMELTTALERLLRPLNKVHFPVHEMSLMMSIALRFIPTLVEETDKIMKAQTARGADFSSGGLMEKAKALVPLLVPLFVSAFRRAYELALAMEARCYNGGEGRTKLYVSHFHMRDLYASIVVAALIVFLCFGF